MALEEDWGFQSSEAESPQAEIADGTTDATVFVRPANLRQASLMAAPILVFFCISCLSMFSAHHTHARSLSNICTSPAIYSSDSDDEQVVADARVVNTSQPRLNGRVAAAATFDARSQRYLVEGLTENGIPLALKPENVILPPRCRVRVNRPPMTPSPEPITRTHHSNPPLTPTEIPPRSPLTLHPHAPTTASEPPPLTPS